MARGFSRPAASHTPLSAFTFTETRTRAQSLFRLLKATRESRSVVNPLENAQDFLNFQWHFPGSHIINIPLCVTVQARVSPPPREDKAMGQVTDTSAVQEGQDWRHQP
jgi:hypothetical protein